MKSFTTPCQTNFEFDSAVAINNKLYNITTSGVYDPDTYTITDPTEDLSALFVVGGIVMNACYNDIYATVVSVTANEVVLDGPIRGYYDNAGTIEWYQGYLVMWDDATSAFQITAKKNDGPFVFGNYTEFTKSYPGDYSWTAPLRSSKLVSYDGVGDVATLDWPCAVMNDGDSYVACGNGSNSVIDVNAVTVLQFWMGDGYYMDIGIGGGKMFQYYEFHDGYGLSNGNQTEEQLYSRYDAIIQRWSDMLSSNYKDDSAPLGEDVFGAYVYMFFS